jgi:AcrR family transcriptional regulator
MTIMTTERKTPNIRKHTQARGRARREILLLATREMLREREMDEITLPNVAEAADIPSSSTYHFFPDIKTLYQEVARAIAEDMVHIAQLPTDPHVSWQDLVRQFIVAGAGFFNANRDARQLILGPKTVHDIRNAACVEDHRFGHQLHALLATHFHLPDIEHPVELCFRAIQISDALFSLSVSEHGYISEEMRDEAVLASTAYIGCYLPIVMRRKTALPVS